MKAPKSAELRAMFAKRVVYWMCWMCLLEMLQHPVGRLSVSSESLPPSLPCSPGMSPALALFMNHVDLLTEFDLLVCLSIKSYLKIQQFNLLLFSARECPTTAPCQGQDRTVRVFTSGGLQV
jgi:hypothetical protein